MLKKQAGKFVTPPYIQVLVQSEQFCFHVFRLVFFFFFFLQYCMACRILVSQPGMEPRTHQLKHRVLISGVPGNSHRFNAFLNIMLVKKESSQGKALNLCSSWDTRYRVWRKGPCWWTSLRAGIKCWKTWKTGWVKQGEDPVLVPPSNNKTKSQYLRPQKLFMGKNQRSQL